MKLTFHIPDELAESFRDVLPPPEMGLLEAIALDAFLKYLFNAEREKNEQSKLS